MMASPLAPNTILMLLSSLLVRHKASMGIFQEGKPCPGLYQQEENIQNVIGLEPLAVIRPVLSALYYHRVCFVQKQEALS